MECCMVLVKTHSIYPISVLTLIWMSHCENPIFSMVFNSQQHSSSPHHPQQLAVGIGRAHQAWIHFFIPYYPPENVLGYAVFLQYCVSGVQSFLKLPVSGAIT